MPVYAKGVDYSFGRPSPSSLKAAGYSFVVRYLSGGKSAKDITPTELKALLAAGLSVALVWEAGGEAAKGGYRQGAADGTAALAQATSLKFPTMPVVYTAIDFDPTDAQLPVVVEYVRGFASVLKGKAGVYGGTNVMNACKQAGVVGWFWHTYAWGVAPAFCQLRQVRNSVSVAGATVDLCEAWAEDFGQYPRPVSKGPNVPLEHTVAATLARCAQEAAHQTQDWTDLCDHFSGIAWGIPHSGSPTAREHWLAIPANRKHPGDHNVPPGGLKFYGIESRGQGHVTVKHLSGEWTTDRVKPGKVALAPDGTDYWGLPYLGWADPVFPGAGADFGHLTYVKPTPPPAPKPPAPRPGTAIPVFPGNFGRGSTNKPCVTSVQVGLVIPHTGIFDWKMKAKVAAVQAREFPKLGAPTGVVNKATYDYLARPI